MNSLKERNLYAFNILKAGTTSFDSNYSYLVSTLLHLESEIEIGSVPYSDFAKTLLNIVNKSSVFVEIDRVCLAVTQSGSSRISVVSSFNSTKIKENNMSGDYSCFVSRKSSILDIKKTDVRIYSNIDSILERYNGNPAQRSLRLLKEMGVKSGLTIPLSISNLSSGFIFLNSAKIGAFDKLNSEDYSVLCLIKLLSLSCLSKFTLSSISTDLKSGDFFSELNQKENVFSPEALIDFLGRATLHFFEFKVEMQIKNLIKKQFLVAMRPMVYLIIRSLELSNSFMASKKIDIEINEYKKPNGNSYVEFKLMKINLSKNQISSLRSLEKSTSFELSNENENFLIRSSLDEKKNVDYSV